MSIDPILTLFAKNLPYFRVASSKTLESEEGFEQACRDANIWDFITSLPNEQDTNVVGAGALLSRGQKQRIAIARGIILQLKLLLLDKPHQL